MKIHSTVRMSVNLIIIIIIFTPLGWLVGQSHLYPPFEMCKCSGAR